MKIFEAAPTAAILLDEAYFHFYGETMMDEIGKISNLFIARTFSKAYGLAGMRLGLIAGPEEQNVRAAAYGFTFQRKRLRH